MFADSHAHLTCDPVYENIDAILDRAHREQIDTIINITIDKTSLERALDFTTSLVTLRHSGATTPHDVETDGERHFPSFEKAAKEKKLIAIGETGLDYYYDHSNRDAQKEYFIKYLTLAKECNLPVIIHCRDAFTDFFRIIDEHYNRESVLMHCFTGTKHEALEAIERGFTISFSGILTFKRSDSLREIAKIVPLEKTLIETDTPYLAPQSKRGKPNEPSFLPETAECLASLHDISLEEIASITRTNTYRFFQI